MKRSEQKNKLPRKTHIKKVEQNTHTHTHTHTTSQLAATSCVADEQAQPFAARPPICGYELELLEYVESCGHLHG